MAFCNRIVKDCKLSSPYLKFASNLTSQGGEDGILQILFGEIGLGERPYCVDIGAWDGKHLSNTYNLIANGNWGGLLVEADPARHEELTKLYSERPDVTCICALAGIEGAHSLNNLLLQACVPKELDFLSIDVDGADYHLWNTLSGQFFPRVVCIEFNPTIPNDVIFIQEKDIRIQQGSSLLAIKDLGESLGYALIVTTLFNAIFVRKDLVHLLKFEVTNDLNDLHSSSMVTEIFQTYDGEIKVVGPRKLIWHKVSLNPEKMQPISKKQRQFLFRPGALGDSFKSEKPVEWILLSAKVSLIVNLFVEQSSPNKDINVSFNAATTDAVEYCSSLLPLAHCEEIALDALFAILHIMGMSQSIDDALKLSVALKISHFLKRRGENTRKDSSAADESCRWFLAALGALSALPANGPMSGREEAGDLVRKIDETCRRRHKDSGGTAALEGLHWARCLSEWGPASEPSRCATNAAESAAQQKAVLKIFHSLGISYDKYKSLVASSLRSQSAQVSESLRLQTEGVACKLEVIKETSERSLDTCNIQNGNEEQSLSGFDISARDIALFCAGAVVSAIMCSSLVPSSLFVVSITRTQR
jgi:hypothetical protein